ncbi:hypothetical protein ES703_111900 [subsurface metagenome]
MTTLLIAVPTVGELGLKDKVSNVFSRAETFTILEVEGKEIQNVTVEKNIASALKQGAGPLAIKKLKDQGVNTVLCPELGPGAKTMLDVFGIKTIRVESGIKVRDALKDALENLASAQ